MATTVHPTAIIESGARLGEGVAVGPYCHIGPDVVIGPGARFHAHVVVTGRTTIGADGVFFPSPSLAVPRRI